MLKRLTEQVVRDATGHPRKQQVFLWDSTTAGLGLRVTSKGKRAWVFRYSRNGRDRRLTLGPYPEVSLSKARSMVAAVRERVERGEDPARENPAAAAPRTLAGLQAEFEARHLARRSLGHRRNVVRDFERKILPFFGADTEVGALTWEWVDDFRRHVERKHGPVSSNRAIAHLRAALGFARRLGWIPRGAPNPAADHQANREAKPGRPFSNAELAKIGQALEQEDDPVQRVALYVLFLSGLRPREVCHLRWENLDEGGLVTIVNGKTGPRVAALSTTAERLIRSLPVCGDWMFPGRRAGDPLGGHGVGHGLTAAWRRVQRRSGVKRRLYDARHNWISTAAACGIGDDVRRVLAGHASGNGSAHSVYLHAVPALRGAADTVAERIAEALHLTEPARVG